MEYSKKEIIKKILEGYLAYRLTYMDGTNGDKITEKTANKIIELFEGSYK